MSKKKPTKKTKKPNRVKDNCGQIVTVRKDILKPIKIIKPPILGVV